MRITGTGNDCEVIGHTLNTYDLAGCTICMDCGARIFCPVCIQKHPTDSQALAILCLGHEERKKAMESPDNFAYVILVDYKLHTSAKPFCYDESCPCKEDQDDTSQVAQFVTDGLMTPDEATNFVKEKGI